jgi:hypothetical protein
MHEKKLETKKGVYKRGITRVMSSRFGAGEYGAEVRVAHFTVERPT